MASGTQLKPKNATNSTFHVTAHGVGKLKPFLRNVDKRDFLERFARYLSPEYLVDSARHPYEKLFSEVAVLAYCVLDNHFHLILHQFTADGMERLMRRILTGYGKTYNRNHNRKGPILDGRYAAEPIETSNHLREALGYTILNNPIEQLDYEFSSHAVMIGDRSSSWLRTDLALGVFDGVDDYRRYMNRTGPRRVSSKLTRWGIDPTLHPYRGI